MRQIAWMVVKPITVDNFVVLFNCTPVGRVQLNFDFNFDIVNFPFLDGDVSWRTSYSIYISQLIRFARASSNVIGFYCRNKAVTAKLLKQGYRYHKLRKAYFKFYRRHSELVKNILLAWGNFCNKAYWNQKFMVT